MKYDFCILSQDTLYAQWITLTLTEKGARVIAADNPLTAPSSAVYIVDLDSCALPKKDGASFICFSRDSETLSRFGGLLRPFSEEELFSAIEGGARAGDESVSTDESDRTVSYGGRRIRLTEREYMLFSLLAEAKGKSVPREEICRKIWQCDDTESLNIYIYYLRRKLEMNGVKAIKAHRGKGYSLITRGEIHAIPDKR